MEQLMKPDEVAQVLGLSPAQLAQQRYKGTGPKFVKVNGRRVRYRRADVEAYVESRTFAQTGGVK